MLFVDQGGEAKVVVKASRRRAGAPHKAIRSMQRMLLVEQWDRLYKAGFSYREIAKASGYSVGHVFGRIKKLGEFREHLAVAE